MNTMNMPGFTAERSLFESSSQHIIFSDAECNDAIRPKVVGALGGNAAITWPGPRPDFENNLNWGGSPSTAAESAPGGPSTVPSGYGRDCKRVPYTICDANGCRTEYGWVCTYYPLLRA